MNWLQQGRTNFRLAQLFIDNEQLNVKKELIEYQLTEAMKNFSDAYTHGFHCKVQDWQQQILTSSLETMELAIEYENSTSDAEHRAKILRKWVKILPDDLNKGYTNIERAKLHFHIAITAGESCDYKKALHQLHECYGPIEEAQRDAKDDGELQIEIDIMRTDVWVQLCVAESVQARYTGDHYLDVVLKDYEYLNMNMAWEVADWYRKAILLTKEHDIENEAIAYSRLGRLYEKVFKINYRAKENYKRSLQLAQSLYPMTFTEFDWYIEAMTAMERYQQEAIKRDDAEHQKKKDEALKEYTKELKQLNTKSSVSDVEYLKFAYSTFPPKQADHKLRGDVADIDQSALKKTCQIAILHYHPDRQKKEYGEGWKYFCEEITKQLNKRYDKMKNVN